MSLAVALAQAARLSKQSVTLEIETAHDSKDELNTKAAIETMARDYDLRPWTFTSMIMIDQTAIPHSHPVLTINTRHLGNKDALLSTYLHEELHWFLKPTKRRPMRLSRFL